MKAIVGGKIILKDRIVENKALLYSDVVEGIVSKEQIPADAEIIDAKGGYVATDGWTKVLDVKAVDFAKQMESYGVKNIIYTDIATDGMLQGPNIPELCNLAENVNVDITASGGISGIDDVKALEEKGFYGAIIGKAIYEGRIKVEELV